MMKKIVLAVLLVYPRMYGETQNLHGLWADLLGLSPHVRGNLRTVWTG